MLAVVLIKENILKPVSNSSNLAENDRFFGDFFNFLLLIASENDVKSFNAVIGHIFDKIFYTWNILRVLSTGLVKTRIYVFCLFFLGKGGRYGKVVSCVLKRIKPTGFLLYLPNPLKTQVWVMGCQPWLAKYQKKSLDDGALCYCHFFHVGLFLKAI